MQPKAVAGRVIHARNRRKNDVAPVLPHIPIDHIVLPIDPDVEPADRKGQELAFPVGREGKTLLVDEGEAAQQCRGRHIRDLTDSREGHLVYQHLEDELVIARLALTGGRFLVDREGLATAVAAIARVANLGLAADRKSTRLYSSHLRI